METDYIIIDTVDADTVEVGDQVILDGELIEVTAVGEDEECPLEGVTITGYSHESGDKVTHSVYFAERIDLWSV